MLVIPVSFIRMFGVMIGDNHQGWALLGAVAVLFALGTAGIGLAETLGHGTVASAVGSAAEGTETRFGIPGSALFGQAATAFRRRCSELLLRQLRQPRWRGADGEHDAR